VETTYDQGFWRRREGEVAGLERRRVSRILWTEPSLSATRRMLFVGLAPPDGGKVRLGFGAVETDVLVICRSGVGSSFFPG